MGETTDGYRGTLKYETVLEGPSVTKEPFAKRILTPEFNLLTFITKNQKGRMEQA